MILRTYSKDVAIPLPVTDFSSLLYIGFFEGMRVGDKRRLIIPPSLGYILRGRIEEGKCA
ncbi:hypothetical protein YC2023_116466 [Brassica napus]|uniref:Rotamase n=1 Tax=Brassica napus TaxID=3708 RepID=A0A816IY32_BRANA|nr:unnamed protein product [Brassica napus]